MSLSPNKPGEPVRPSEDEGKPAPTGPASLASTSEFDVSLDERYALDYYGDANEQKPSWTKAQVKGLLNAGRIEDDSLAGALRYGLSVSEDGWYNHIPPDKAALVTGLIYDEPAAIVASRSELKSDMSKILKLLVAVDPSVEGVNWQWDGRVIGEDASWDGPTPRMIREGVTGEPFYDDPTFNEVLGDQLFSLDQLLTDIGVHVLPEFPRVPENDSDTYSFSLSVNDLRSYDGIQLHPNPAVVKALAEIYLGVEVEEADQELYAELTAHMEGALGAFRWTKNVLHRHMAEADETDKPHFASVYTSVDAEHVKLSNDYLKFFVPEISDGTLT